MCHVLIVDDYPDAGPILIHILRRLGHTAEHVTSGEAAIARLEGDLPDLVILDMMMPDMSGFEVLKVLRSNEHTAALRVVLYSAFRDPELVQQSVNAGADGFWVKASDIDVLSRDLNKMLPPLT